MREPRAPHGDADVYVGLMSGTSTDGVSAAAVRFVEGAGTGARRAALRAEVLAFAQWPFTREQRERLHAAMQGGTAREYCRLSVDLGQWLADVAAALLADAKIPTSRVRVVASHGQTLWHEPGYATWQLGEAAVIAEELGVDVVSDFRVRDVAAGGQGAPLVPVADALLFAADDRWRALQNIGGIGNVTVVPPRGSGDEPHAGDPHAGDPLAGVRAFDTGPGVAVIDGVARRFRPELPYDVDGRLARAGTPLGAVVDELLADPYFAQAPPKSTGRELFSPAYVERLIEKCRALAPESTDCDVVATAVRLTARSIADAYRRFLPEPVDEVLLSGGGARNPALVDALRDELRSDALRHGRARVALFDDVFFDGEAKEAVAFALLGWLHVHGRGGNVPAATGARGSRVLGKLTPA